MCIPKNINHNFTSRLLRFRTLWCSFTRFNPLFWPFTWFRSIVVDPCCIHRHKSTKKLFRIAVKIGQILLPSGHTNAFLVECEQLWHPSCTELSHAQMCMQNIDHTLSWDGYDLSYNISRTFTFRSFKTIWWILLTISGVVISFGWHRLMNGFDSNFDRRGLKDRTCQQW